MLWIPLSLVFFHGIRIIQCDCPPKVCNPWTKDNDGTVNVHLICHSHDDPGWLKTVDQYYYGSNNRLVLPGVQYIINTVIDELQKDSTRRFIWAETSFLWRYIIDHDDSQNNKLLKLVQNGQLELVGGGWVQNDEAASHYIDIIDQMTLGFEIIQKYYGKCALPHIGWQIDPFGHSREMANLLAMMDVDALFFSRINYLEKVQRLQNKSLEFIWEASDDLKTNILTSVFYGDSYGPPPGFCFDALCRDPPIMNNVIFGDYNVGERIKHFVEYVKKQASHQRTNHIMLLMGSDFQYTNANQWYTNLDKLLNVMKKRLNDTKINIFYSTPSCYLRALQEAKPQLPKRSDDFFPYATSDHSYWTGFYTSRPAFKGFIRESSALLQLVKSLKAFASIADSGKRPGIFERAIALAQHHDAVTGTAKENVTLDYRKRLSTGWDEAEVNINEAFLKLASKTNQPFKQAKQVFCRLINESICEAARLWSNFTLIVYNGNSCPQAGFIRIPYYYRYATVTKADGKLATIQMNKIFYRGKTKTDGRAPYELIISANIPALGFTTFFVSNSTTVRETNYRSTDSKLSLNDAITMKNEFIELSFAPSGHLTAYRNLKTGQKMQLKQKFFYYEGMGFKTGEQASGAYIFRPNGTKAKTVSQNVSLQIVEGQLVNESRQFITPWISQTIRLFKGKNYVEFEWTVGPIPKEAKWPVTKEVITRYSTDIRSGQTFFTDSNGRQILTRVRDSSPTYPYYNTEPVAGNYYPVNTGIIIRDDSTQMTVLTDRSQGATSLESGQIELMLHRRAFYDDGFGVDEALDEPGDTGLGLVIRGKHWLLIDTPSESTKQHRKLAKEMYHRPVITFSQLSTTISEYRQEFYTEFTGLARPLPEYLNIISLATLSPSTLLVRLEHIYQGREDGQVSIPAKANLKGLFTTFDVIGITELNLAAVEKTDFASWSPRGSIYETDELAFQLLPMEIRTFNATVRMINAYYRWPRSL